MPDRIDLAHATGADGPDEPVSGERLTHRERPRGPRLSNAMR